MFIIKPYKDELFSSLIVRLSRKNYTNISTILYHIFSRNHLSTKDLDLYKFGNRNILKLQQYINVNINKHQLYQFNSYLEENISNNARHVWLTTSNQNPYYKNFYGARFCPYCLQEKPYIKLSWRIMLFNICKKHLCYLDNTCEKCGSRIIYANNSYEKEIYHCYKCNNDIRNNTVRYLNNTSKHLCNQVTLEDILNKGYYKYINGWGYSFSLFYLIKFICNILIRLNKRNIHYLEQLKPFEVAKLISFTLLLLENFPYKFNKFLSNNHLTNFSSIYGRYRTKTKNLPQWFVSELIYNTRIQNGHSIK